MTTVLDASTLLALLQDEPGSDVVEAALHREPICSAANWSEIAQKIHAAERDSDLVEALLMSYDLTGRPALPSSGRTPRRRHHHRRHRLGISGPNPPDPLTPRLVIVIAIAIAIVGNARTLATASIP